MKTLYQFYKGQAKINMNRILIENFDIKINKENVLKTLGCFEGSEIYNTVSKYFDEEEDVFFDLICPIVCAMPEGMRIYCVMTLGEKISGYSKSLFDKGEGMRGILVDAMADDYLFAMDKVLAERIKFECAKLGYGVRHRLDAPKDFPLSENKVIIEKTGVGNVSLTSAFMFDPVKTLAYILELTDDKTVFNAQHDCSKCPNFDCPRRSVQSRGKFEALSGYEFNPSLQNYESVVCIDIGTTTVVFELITKSGVCKTYKTINPQRRFGIDVLSRIEAANRGRLEELSSLIRYTLINGYNDVTREYGGVEKVVIAGNTSMVHLLMEYSCTLLGEYPFNSEHLDILHTDFAAVTGGGDKVSTVIYGGISAFVGGDIVSGLYMCDFDKSDKVNFFIDLGTNGEMAIGNREKIVVTSAAAGPAFEGGRISCGMGSVDGAICGIDIKNGTIKTISDKPPVGICGTGIIELISELLDSKIIDRTGLLSEDYFVNGYKVSEDVVFTQNDIRQVQMAKSAVRAGIEILAEEYGISTKDINTVYLAGGFGYGLSENKACNIGILPKEFAGKIKVLGNASLGGCVKYCSMTDGDERINHIKEISKEISLGNNENFNKMYIEYMNF